MKIEDFERFKEQMEEQGYFHIINLDNGGVAGLYKFIFTTDVISEMSEIGYGKRWSYEKTEDAINNLLILKLGGEPTGWTKKYHE